MVSLSNPTNKAVLLRERQHFQWDKVYRNKLLSDSCDKIPQPPHLSLGHFH